MLLRILARAVRAASALLACCLLAPVPVYATLAFTGNWTATGSWSDTGSTPGTGQSKSTLKIQAFSGSTPANTPVTFAFTAPVAFTVNGSSADGVQISSSAFNNNLSLTSGTLQIQTAILLTPGGPSIPFNTNTFNGPYPQTVTLNAPNQFVSVVPGTNTYYLQVSFTFSNPTSVTAWSTPSSPSTLSITFTGTSNPA
jgi:hypothetical protein